MNKAITTVLSPARMIIISFFILILCGTALLALPCARTQSISCIDLLFTATSATCVTGLFTIPLDAFTLFGKIIILLLIQVGALGLATMSLFILSLFMDLGIATKNMAGQLLEVTEWQDIKTMLLFITAATLTTEFIGACIFFFIFSSHYPLDHAFFYAIFHAISSFCNAGISFLHNLTEQNLETFNTNYLFIFTTSILIFLGGLGFITWHESMHYLHSLCTPSKPYRFSLHSKIILYGIAFFLTSTSFVFWLLEHANTLSHFSFPLMIANTVFHAISFKSCGFFIATLGQFHMATLFFIIMVAFVGSSPGSTGSGVKITTFVVFLCAIKAGISGKDKVDILGREIPLDQVYKAITIVSLSIGWILCATFFLLITEPDWNFMELFFETTSAFSNLGFSLKGTEYLTSIGKVIIMITMFIGRIGSLTFILGLKTRTKESAEFSYPEERIMLG